MMQLQSYLNEGSQEILGYQRGYFWSKNTNLAHISKAVGGDTADNILEQRTIQTVSDFLQTIWDKASTKHPNDMIY